MEQNAVVAGFSVVFFTQFCVEWLTLEDICLLDTSMSHTTKREYYLNVISSLNAVFGGSSNSSSWRVSFVPNFSSWLTLRQVSVRNGCVCMQDISDVFSVYLTPKTYSRLHTLTLQEQENINYTSLSILSNRLTNLRVLTFIECSFTSCVYPPSFSVSFSALTELSISECELPLHIVELLSSACSGSLLQLSLDLMKQWNVTATLHSFLTACTVLSGLELSGCNGITDGVALAVCSSPCRAAMSSLALNNGAFYNRNITDGTLDCLAADAPALRSLSLGNCNVTSAGVVALLAGCSKLEELSLPNCSRLANHAFTTIPCTARYSLQKLNLSNCCYLTEEGLSPLLNALRCLRVLDLSHLKRITDALFTQWRAEACRHLTSIKLHNCCELTLSAVQCMALKFVAIVSVNMRYCTGVEDAATAVALLCMARHSTLRSVDCTHESGADAARRLDDIRAHYGRIKITSEARH